MTNPTLLELFDLGVSVVEAQHRHGYWNPPAADYTVACGLGCIMLGSMKATHPDATGRQLKELATTALEQFHAHADHSSYGDDIAAVLNGNDHWEAANEMYRVVEVPDEELIDPAPRSFAAAMVVLNDVLLKSLADIRTFIDASTP